MCNLNNSASNAKKTKEATTQNNKNVAESPNLKVVKGENPQTPEIKKDEKPLSVEERKEKINKLFLMAEKHNELKESLKGLEEFNIVHDSEVCEMTLRDSKGKSFKSSNPEAIEKMIDFCKTSLQNKINTLETQINL